MPEPANEQRRLFAMPRAVCQYGPGNGTVGGWATLASLPNPRPDRFGRRARHAATLSQTAVRQAVREQFQPTPLAPTEPHGCRPATSGSTSIVAMMPKTIAASDLAADAACPYVSAGLRRAGSAADGCSGFIHNPAKPEPELAGKVRNPKSKSKSDS